MSSFPSLLCLDSYAHPSHIVSFLSSLPLILWLHFVGLYAYIYIQQVDEGWVSFSHIFVLLCILVIVVLYFMRPSTGASTEPEGSALSTLDRASGASGSSQGQTGGNDRITGLVSVPDARSRVATTPPSGGNTVSRTSTTTTSVSSPSATTTASTGTNTTDTISSTASGPTERPQRRRVYEEMVEASWDNVLLARDMDYWWRTARHACAQVIPRETTDLNQASLSYTQFEEFLRILRLDPKDRGPKIWANREAMVCEEAVKWFQENQYKLYYLKRERSARGGTRGKGK